MDKVDKVRKNGYQQYNVGQRFGQLTIVKVLPNDKSGMYQKYMCVCDCGNNYRVGHYYFSHPTHPAISCRTCGRARQGEARTLASVETVPANVPNRSPLFNVVYSRLRHSAQRREIKFDLTKQDVANIIFEKCIYCDAEPASVSHDINNARKHTQFDSEKLSRNGIDRLDNSLGYVAANCVPCCHKCNSIKGAITKDMLMKVVTLMGERDLL